MLILKPAIVVALFFVALMGGCTDSNPVATPLSLRGNESYGDRVALEVRGGEAMILFATDRHANADRSPTKRYDSRRAMEVALGTVHVRFGREGMAWDTLAERTTHGERIGLTLESIEEFGVLPATVRVRDAADAQDRSGVREFAREVDRMIEASGDATATVFVPGFNTTFAWGVEKAAFLWHLSGRRGVVIPYCWPAHGTFFDYARDRESGAITARGLREFILMLAEETAAERINVFTYSAGAPVLANALHQMRLLFADGSPEDIRRATKLNEVVFAGADLDLDFLSVFALDRLQDVARRLTFYTSRIDNGVRLSDMFYFHSSRVGRAEKGLDADERAWLGDHTVVNVIDVTQAQLHAGRGDIFGHAYWYGNAWVCNDLLRLLMAGGEPGSRGLVHTESGDGVWRFPEDYPAGVSATGITTPEPAPAKP